MRMTGPTTTLLLTSQGGTSLAEITVEYPMKTHSGPRRNGGNDLIIEPDTERFETLLREAVARFSGTFTEDRSRVRVG